MKSYAKLIQYFLNIRSEATLSFHSWSMDFICSLSIKHGGSNVLEAIFCQNWFCCSVIAQWGFCFWWNCKQHKWWFGVFMQLLAFPCSFQLHVELFIVSFSWKHLKWPWGIFCTFVPFDFRYRCDTLSVIKLWWCTSCSSFYRNFSVCGQM